MTENILYSAREYQHQTTETYINENLAETSAAMSEDAILP